MSVTAEAIRQYEAIRRYTAIAIANTRRLHQQWHWDTHQTSCPWGCGDGSGIKSR